VIPHRLIQDALRARARTLSVCSTGSTTLASTGATYTRSTGSFITDGFTEGMEVVPTGFVDAATSVVSSVAALTLTVARALSTETSASGRTLAVGLPRYRAWENREFVAPTATPWIEEQWANGANSLFTNSPNGWIEHQSIYVLLLHLPKNVGADAANAYADALLEHFAPATNLTLSTGDAVRVRADVAPWRGQVIPGDVWATVPLSIPLRLYTLNTA